MSATSNDFLTVLTPVADGPDTRLVHLLAIEQALRSAQPFSKCPMVHMARFVVIGELPWQPGDTRREFLARNYLLFVAELSGQRDDFLDALYKHNDTFVHSIWSHCVGYPHYLHEAFERGRFHGGIYGASYFRRYINAHTIDKAIRFTPYPGATVGEIEAALEARSKLTDFVASNPPWATSDQKLQAEFNRVFR